MQFTAQARPEHPVRETALPAAQPEPAAAAGDAKARPREATERERHLRSERHAYAQGLEKILLSHGVGGVSVLAYEGQAGPAPTLMFVGQFSREFVHRALTDGAVLARAKQLGFRSVDFFHRGPDGHYQFVLPRTGPLPKCAAYNRLCL
jgi:hypothetical protein